MAHEKNTIFYMRVINTKKCVAKKAVILNTVLPFASGKAEVVLGRFYKTHQ